jgi:hypothetical protein
MPSSYPLHKAIEKGNLSSVKKLVKENKEYLNNKDYCGRTPLTTAVLHKEHKIAEFLLSQGANTSDHDGIPLLHSVVSGVSKDAVDILKIFLKYQVDPNVLDDFGSVPINYTVGRLNFELTFLLLTFPTIKVDIEDRFGKNPLEHLLIRFESEANAEQERLKKDYTKCIRAFLLKGAIVRKSILCKYLPEKYEEIQKLIHSIMESIQEKFKLPEDIKSTQILLQLDSWQWALLWSTAISRGNPKRKPFFEKLPTELVQMVIEAALDYRLTQAQITKIFENANFPCKETHPNCEPKGSRRSAIRRFLHIEKAPESKKQAPEATADTFSIRNRP